MEDNSSDVEQLVAQSKKLRDISKTKHDLQNVLSELTVCENVALLSKKQSSFRTKVLRVTCKVIPSLVSPLQCNQTLLLTVQNVSDNITFSCEYWQFCVSMNMTQSTWNLETSLGPGQVDTFCCPLKTSSFLQHKINVALKFTIHFECKTYTRTFHVQDCLIDALYFLDPGRSLGGESSSTLFTADDNKSFVDICSTDHSDVKFPTVTKFMLLLDTSLKEKFVTEICLCDSLHRGFSQCLPELVNKSEISVYYSGNKIDVKISSNTEMISVSCMNSAILCAVKASIFRRLMSIEGIMVDGLNDEQLEKVHGISLKLNAFESDGNPESVDVLDLQELYLELRDISESVRFSVAHVVE